MSIYNMIKHISDVTNVFYKKTYEDEYVVAEFYIGKKKINMYYKDYSRELLKHHILSNKYSKKIVYMDFWDSEFCGSEHISDEDKMNINKTVKNIPTDQSVYAGYLLTLISVYKLIYNSYAIKDFKSIIGGLQFDKNVLGEVFSQVDIVVDLNENLIEIIRGLLPTVNLYKFLVTPSGRFRLLMKNVSSVLEDTRNLHEISTIMYYSIPHKYVIDYYIELLKTSNVIYSPKVITSYDAENILLNVLKLDINLESSETKTMEFLMFYMNKGGSLDIEFRVDYNERYSNALPLLDMFKERHLSY